MYLCAQNHDLKRGGTFETAKAGTFHSVTAGCADFAQYIWLFQK